MNLQTLAYTTSAIMLVGITLIAMGFYYIGFVNGREQGKHEGN